MDLTNRSQIADLLQLQGLHTQKHFGQHFLTNRAILDLIVTTANIQPSDTIVEVGPGIGVLTCELAQRAGRVIAFEIDTTLKPILQQTVGEYGNVEIYFEDFRQVDLGKIVASDYKFVSNLPYNAGSHILDQLLKSPNPPESITVLLQKEVAQKIVAQPPHATYLSNFFQLYGQAKMIKTVAPGAFFPPPQVDSAILHVERVSGLGSRVSTSAYPKPATLEPISFSHFLHRGFANPRKMLNKAFPHEVLQKADIDPSARPENVTFEEWARLFEVVRDQ